MAQAGLRCLIINQELYITQNYKKSEHESCLELPTYSNTLSMSVFTENNQYQETQLTLSLSVECCGFRPLLEVVGGREVRICSPSQPHREQHDLYMLFIYYYRYKI